MKCEEIKEILSGYVDGEARGDDGRLVEEHLAACAGCRDLARRMRIVGAGIERTEGVVPPDFREALFSRMEREGLLSRRRSLLVYAVRWAAVPVAAAAVLALFLLAPREAGKVAPAPSAGPSLALDGRVPRAPEAKERPRGAQGAPEAPATPGGTGMGGTATADSRGPAALTPEEREIVAHLDVLEDPAALEEPSEVDELELVEPAGRTRG